MNYFNKVLFFEAVYDILNIDLVSVLNLFIVSIAELTEVTLHRTAWF
jgi:hypothetical protein